jgi:hypothetical protein
MLRPRTLGKIVIAVLVIICLLTALIFALEAGEKDLYKGVRAIIYTLMALTFATLYRYFED